MAMNPKKMMQAKQSWENFKASHPRLIPFINAAGAQVREGSIVAMSVTDPDGRVIETNLRVTAQDMELIALAREMAGEV